MTTGTGPQHGDRPAPEPLRYIQVGAGGRGKAHLRAALEGGFWRPVALVDVVPAQLATARVTTGLPESACFTRVEDALAAVDADAVAVVSPVRFHAEHIMAALQAGRHVLTEKCFTVGLAPAEACVAEAERRGRKLMVVQNVRLLPTMRTLRRLVAERRYGPPGLFQMTLYKPRGKPYHPSPHMHLWQQGVHELDSLLSVVQQPVRRVTALSNNPVWCDWPSPSTVQALIECEGGVSGTHVSTSNARGGGFELRLECAEAALVCTSRYSGALEVRGGRDGGRLESVALDPPDVHGLEHHPVARAAVDPDGGRDGASTAADPYRLPDLQVYRDFYEYVARGVEPETSGRRNLEVIRLLEAIQRSSEEQRPIDVTSLLVELAAAR
jgi:predicted dehydrogenase